MTSAPASAVAPAAAPTGSVSASTRRQSTAAAAAAHRARYTLAHERAGADLRAAVKTLWKDASFTTWEEAVAELAAGITVRLRCGDQPGNRYATHRIRLTPEGGVVLLDHPDQVIDAEGAEAEWMLVALGSQMCACVAAAVCLPTRRRVPRNTLGGWTAVDTRLRVLHAAVAWAQHPDTPWSPSWAQARLRYGITPAVEAQWVADGWDPEVALRFQQQRVPLSVARAWREAGDTTARAAKLAARGERPDDEAAWARAGFRPGASAKWRRFPYPPEVAFEWEQAGVAPTMVEALLQADRAGWMPLAEAKRWCRAGVRSREVGGWYQHTGGNLDVALAWQGTGVPASTYREVREWNTTHPDHPLTPAVVAAYHRAGLTGTDPNLIGRALTYRVSPEAVAEAVAGLRAGTAPDLAAAISERAPGAAVRASVVRGFEWPTDREGQALAVRSMVQGYHPMLAATLLDCLALQARRG